MRLTLAAASLILLSTHAYASTESQLASCSVVTDKLERLICYDTLVSSASNTAQAMPTKSAVIAAPAIAPKETFGLKKAIVETEDFGLVKKTDIEKIEKLYFSVANIEKDAYGSIIVTLDNEQVWKQKGSQRFKLKQGQKIFIERAALGSFLLGSDDRNSTIRVRRLK
jgi:mannose-6-phosphate isomerase class I